MKSYASLLLLITTMNAMDLTENDFNNLFAYLIELSPSAPIKAVSDNPQEFEVEYLCDKKDCPDGFPTERACYFHFVSEHINAKKKLICPFDGCRFSYVRESYLVAHLDYWHPKTPFKCYHCANGQKYKDFNELKIHLRQNHIGK